MIPKKLALGLDHRKSDVSDLRPCISARTREHPSSGNRMFPICAHVRVPELGNTRVLVVDTGFRKRSCSTKRLERDDDSKKSHPALAGARLLLGGWRGLMPPNSPSAINAR